MALPEGWTDVVDPSSKLRYTTTTLATEHLGEYRVRTECLMERERTIQLIFTIHATRWFK
jgi:hypothetical protein